MANACGNTKIDIGKACNCSYSPCSRKGLCCECLHYHRLRKELPACYFNVDDEKSYDRSIKHYISKHK
ncbi:MAG: hypothetical protein C4554_10490 [Dethiobacter sp.]|nr:MAG: hypothetical protein C4554_10490 [Dethiobacter sp.]